MAVFKKFDHIGIVVVDLNKAMIELSHFFGLECEEQSEIKDAGIRIAFYPLGAGKMELIEFQKPIDGVDSIVLEPRSGVQHVAWQVEDFDGTLKELSDKGLKLISGFPRNGAHGKVAFFYPTKELDLMIEICEVSDEQKG
jgi:lactoylglutathione lyase/methylmalonyl-CoA/ethylmalonyl-CoA epimerase